MVSLVVMQLKNIFMSLDQIERREGGMRDRNIAISSLSPRHCSPGVDDVEVNYDASVPRYCSLPQLTRQSIQVRVTCLFKSWLIRRCVPSIRIVRGQRILQEDFGGPLSFA